MQILIVEDEPKLACTLQSGLEGEGYGVTVSPDGEDGYFRLHSQSFDLVLLDVMLPMKDGYEVCRDLRRARVRTPILMLTARTQDAEKVMGVDMGADTSILIMGSYTYRRIQKKDLNQFGLDVGVLF